MLSLTLFGHFHATLNDEPVHFPTKSASALSAYLILERHAPQPRAHLSTLLWPDSLEEQGRRNLRQTLLRLRQTLPDTADDQPVILAVHDTLQWNPDYPAEIDVRQFEAYMAQAESFLDTPLSETPYPAVAPLKAALDLYADNLLLGFDLLNDFYAEWLQRWRAKFQRQALTGLARLAESYGRAGQPRRMEALARQQLAIAPEREEARRQLMQAYLAQGEYTAALAQFAAYKQYVEEVDIPPAPALQQLHQLATELRLGRATPSDPIPHNIPPEETPFYGRQTELDDLLLWLATPTQRLLTLKGLGGVGKTRLALAAARHFIRPWLTIPPRFPGGVWFVSLAEVQSDNEELVADVIAQSCGWQTHQGETAISALIRYVRANTHLLILDNLEHLSCMPSLILRLLTSAPSLTVLATSRHPLGLQREVTRHLQGLPIPRHERDMTAPSVALLAERIGRRDSTFRLKANVEPDLVRICRALDGWPLALELAASWAELMPAGEIAERVVGNITALQTTMPDLPARHRSMEAALTGSYLLLTPRQQRILARFATLRGGCTLEAAEKILTATAEDMVVLARRGLFHAYEGRYAIHELTRQFALAKLEGMADKTAAQRAHADYYLGLLISLEQELHGPHPLAAIRRLRPERENIYQAWHWAVEQGWYEPLTSALPSLLRFYNMAGLLREGEALVRATRRAVTRPPFAHDLLFAHANLYLRLGEYEAVRALLLTLPPLESLLPDHQLEAHLCWGKLYMIQDHVPEGRCHNEAALALARALGNQTALIASLMQMGMLHDYNAPYHAEVLSLLDGLNDRWLLRSVYIFLGAVSIRYSRYNEALSHWQKALTISIEFDDAYATTSMHNNLGDVLRELGQFPAAEQEFQQAIALSDSLHNEALRMNPLEGWARLCILRGDYEQAIILAQEAHDLAATYGKQVAQMTALSCLGHAYVGLKRWNEAQDVYARALAVPVSGLPRWSMETMAGLAYTAWKQGDKTAAHTYVHQFLDLLAVSFVEGSSSPSLSYNRVVEVLRALGEDAQADAVLARVDGAQFTEKSERLGNREIG